MPDKPVEKELEETKKISTVETSAQTSASLGIFSIKGFNEDAQKAIEKGSRSLGNEYKL